MDTQDMFDDTRLVIWDLDETLWKGTLTEGGISAHVPEHYDLIRTLNRRGIISSICSKNDLEPVKAILLDQNIWDEFVFPSVSWFPKGPRVADIVSSAQLRPETVLFIDDNPSNLGEVQAHVPGIMVATEKAIVELMKVGHLLGKDDHARTRLQQYKLLETKQKEKLGFKDDNSAFLRSSDIVVTLDYDVEKHIDRAIELINRTNQLNFTKNRLTGDRDQMAEALIAKLKAYYYQSAMVHVKDKYGDYGYVGFYLLHNMHGNGVLEHFCFSCRTLGMGIEKYVYDSIGRPKLHVVGEVLSNVFEDTNPDWINIQRKAGGDDRVAKALFTEVRLRGGCDLDALLHYLSADAERVLSETNYIKLPHFVRRDTTTNLIACGTANSNNVGSQLSKIGLGPEEVETKFFSNCAPGTLLVLSAWADVYAPIYRSKTFDFSYAICLYNLFSENIHDVGGDTLGLMVDSWGFDENIKQAYRNAHQTILTDFDGIGLLDESMARANWTKIFDAIPENATLCVLLPNKHGRDNWSLPRVDMLNGVIESDARDRDNVFSVDISEFVGSGDNIQENFPDHVHRMVYYRIYNAIAAIWQRRQSAGVNALASE